MAMQAAELAAPCPELAGAQVTALWVTHRLEELAFADAASFMDDGRIQVCRPETLILNSKQHLRLGPLRDWLFKVGPVIMPSSANAFCGFDRAV